MQLFSFITDSDSFLVVSLSDDHENLRVTNDDMAESTLSVCTAGREDVLGVQTLHEGDTQGNG